MTELYDITMTEAIGYAVKRVMDEHPKLTQPRATRLVKNALIYNCVIDEIVGQAEFLLTGEV